jgi:hypothetical protein
MKKNSTLSGKLKAYSALAGAAAIAGGADAQIIYTDVNPDVTKSANGDSYSLDLNNDATPDFIFGNVFYQFYGIDVAGFTAQVMDLNAAAGTVNSSGYPLPFALNNGTTIDASTTPWNDTTVNGGADYMSLQIGAPYNINMGNWASATDKIMPLRIKIAGQDHYGWARFSSTVTTTSSTFTIKDYAYNATAGQAIVGGQIPAGVEENALSAARVYAYANNVTVDLGADLKAEGTIIVRNLLGEQVYTQTINATQTKFSLSVASGVYMITLNNGGNSITKKVYIQ